MITIIMLEGRALVTLHQFLPTVTTSMEQIRLIRHYSRSLLVLFSLLISKHINTSP